MSEKQAEQQLIHVVVVDDHQVVREGLRMMLEILGEGFSLAGEAADGVSAIKIVEELQPDVVLMDLRMPGMDGLEAIKRIHSEWPQVAIVILTTYNEDEWLLQGLRAGACGYLLKDASSETLFHAIRSAARGETLLQSDILARLLSHTSPKSLRSGSEYARSIELTEREHEVLVAVARGERSKEIAMELGISLRTVGAHLTSIYAKLGVDSRASAVATAIAHGLLQQKG
jgi:NarL family two-component system response regulator YdfI